MDDKLHKKRSKITRTLSRTFWVLMVLAHTPGLISTWRYSIASGFDVEILGGCAVLTAAMLFFALKLFGVPWLKFRTDRRSLVAVFLVVGLIHLDCIHPGLRQALVSKCTVVLVTTSLVLAAPRIARTLRSVRARHESSHKSRPPDGRSGALVYLAAFRPRCWLLALSYLRLRAPPV